MDDERQVIEPFNPEDDCRCGSSFCLEFLLSRELDTITLERIPQDIHNLPYQLDTLWSLLTGRPRDVSAYLAKLAQYRVERHCALAWSPNYVAYRCRTCSKALTMALCADCFKNGNHQGHDYNMFKSRSGGACDCGYSIMKESGHCCRHGRNIAAEHDNEPIPESLICVPKRAMPRLIHKLAIHLRRSLVDLSELDSYLDCLTRLANSSAAIRGLMSETLIDEQIYSSQLTLLCNHPDKDLSMIVNQGLKKLKREKKGLLLRLPEDWTPAPLDIRAFYQCPDQSSFVDEFLFWTVEQEFPQKLVCFLLSFLMDERYKLLFAKSFVKYYPRIVMILAGVRGEPRRQSRDSFEQLSRRILQISVQLYNYSDLTKLLCEQENSLHILIYCLRVAIEGSPSYGLRGVLKPNPLSSNSTNAPKVVCLDDPMIRDRHLGPLTEDLNAILDFEHQAKRLVRDQDLLNIWMDMLSYFQAMSPYKRELTEHTPFETGPHFSIFTIEADFCLSPLCSILNHIKDDPEAILLVETLLTTNHRALSNWFHKMNIGPNSLLDPYVMTFHIPLHRMFAITLRHMLFVQKRNEQDLYNFLVSNQSLYGKQYGYRSALGTNTNLSMKDFLKMLLLHPLQALTLYHEIRSNMWTRNGLMTMNQAITYVHSAYSYSTVDLDMFMLKYCATKLNPNYFLEILLSRFRAWKWLSFKSNNSMSNAEEYIRSTYHFNISSEQIILMAESSLVLLIQLLTLNLYCDISDTDQTKQELNALISVADRPYSYLIDMLPCRPGYNPADESNFEALLDEIALYKRASHGTGGVLQQGYYTLKPQVWEEEYNPIFVQYRFFQRRDYQVSLERFFQHARTSGNLEKRLHSSALWPPLRIPRNIGKFGHLDLSPLVESPTLVGIVYSIIFKSLYIDDVSESIMAYAIHLLELALRKALTRKGVDGADMNQQQSAAFIGKLSYEELGSKPAYYGSRGEASIKGNTIYALFEDDQQQKSDGQQDCADQALRYPVVRHALDLAFETTWFPFKSIVSNCLVHIDDVHSMHRKDFELLLRESSKARNDNIAGQADTKMSEPDHKNRDYHDNSVDSVKSSPQESQPKAFYCSEEEEERQRRQQHHHQQQEEGAEEDELEDDDDTIDLEILGHDDESELEESSSDEDIFVTLARARARYEAGEATEELGEYMDRLGEEIAGLTAPARRPNENQETEERPDEWPGSNPVQSALEASTWSRRGQADQVQNTTGAISPIPQRLLASSLRNMSPAELARIYELGGRGGGAPSESRPQANVDLSGSESRVGHRWEGSERASGDHTYSAPVAMEVDGAPSGAAPEAGENLSLVPLERRPARAIETGQVPSGDDGQSFAQNLITADRPRAILAGETRPMIAGSARPLALEASSRSTSLESRTTPGGSGERALSELDIQARFMGFFQTCGEPRSQLNRNPNAIRTRQVARRGGPRAVSQLTHTNFAVYNPTGRNEREAEDDAEFDRAMRSANEIQHRFLRFQNLVNESRQEPARGRAIEASGGGGAGSKQRRARRLRNEQMHHGESLLSLLLRLHAKYSQCAQSYQFEPKRAERARALDQGSRLGDGVYFVTIVLDLICTLDRAMRARVGQLNRLIWAHKGSCQPASAAGQASSAAPRPEPSGTLEQAAPEVAGPSSAWASQTAAERRQRAKEYQQRLMADFANRQQAFIKHCQAASSGERTKKLDKGDEQPINLSSKLSPQSKPQMSDCDKRPRQAEPAHEGARSSVQAELGGVKSEPAPLYECCICGLEEPSELANPLGQVVLLQASSVLGHAHLRPAQERPLPCSELDHARLKEETYAKHLERRIDLLAEHFSQSSWLDSINIGAEGGVHVQSCGHYLHIECHQSYIKSLDQTDRLRSRSDSDEFLCPVCRQLANSVLPVLAGARDPDRFGLVLQAGSKQQRDPQQSGLASDQLDAQIDRLAELLNRRLPPNQRELQSSASFCAHLTKATGPQYRLVRSSASMHSLFLFLASIARTNLEASVVARLAGREANETVQRRTCFRLLLHVLALNAQTLISDQWFTCAQVWLQLTARPDHQNRLSVRPADSEVPLLVKDPTAILLQFLLVLPSADSPAELGHFTCLIRLLFNLVAVQSLALVLTYLEPSLSETLDQQDDEPGEPTGLRQTLVVLRRHLGPLLRASEAPLLNAAVRNCWHRYGFSSDKPKSELVGLVESRAKLACLPFLRAAASAQHHLYKRPYPDPPKQSGSPDWLAIGEEFGALATALALVKTDARSTVGLVDTLTWPRAAGPHGDHLIASWSSEMLRLQTEFPIAARSLLACRSLAWFTPSLMRLPHHFDDIFMFYYRKPCSLCHQIPKDVAVCLVCGAPICFRVSCCKDRSRSRQVHSAHCGANTAVFLAVHTSSVVVIRGNRACVWGSVYLDAHDEEDNGLQRGKPLYLVPERFELLERQWLTHSFDHTCGKRWIYLHESQ